MRRRDTRERNSTVSQLNICSKTLAIKGIHTQRRLGRVALIYSNQKYIKIKYVFYTFFFLTRGLLMCWAVYVGNPRLTFTFHYPGNRGALRRHAVAEQDCGYKRGHNSPAPTPKPPRQGHRCTSCSFQSCNTGFSDQLPNAGKHGMTGIKEVNTCNAIC